ncbi:acyl-CoA dehydrogenase family protein [Sphingomonas sp.]|uniref:acyl-CoA dehydrogenase family protein n=1 Tax=Sphingomonas sp. TaxID=28214 RepID=UPI003CC677DE
MNDADEHSAFGDTLSKCFASADRKDTWARLVEMGATALRVPERLGGLGLGAAAIAPVFEALGEHCRPSPYLDTAVVAVRLLVDAATEESDGLLRAIALHGERVAVAGIDRRLRGKISATPTATGWRLDGDALLVVDDADAAFLLVAARTERGGTALLVASRDQRGVTGRSYPTIDGRFATDLRFIDARAVLLKGGADELLTAATDEAIACLAIEAAALMRRLVADTAAYAKQREQFGQPIARFQVVQHRLVDMHIAARRTYAIARRAVASLDGGWQERGRLASAAKATAAEAGRFVGQQAVQLHGGMGTTDELPVGRYFKRLTVIEGELGGHADHVRRYADLAVA